jgi:hypothetical protein
MAELREWLLLDTTNSEAIRRVSRGLTSEVVAGVAKLMTNMDLILAAKKGFVRAPRIIHSNRALCITGGIDWKSGGATVQVDGENGWRFVTSGVNLFCDKCEAQFFMRKSFREGYWDVDTIDQLRVVKVTVNYEPDKVVVIG